MEENVEAQLARMLDALDVADPASSSAFLLQKDLIQFTRLQKLRVPRPVTKHGSNMLKYHKSKMSETEVWSFHEQVFLAALDAHDTKVQAECMDALNKTFPNSLRVKKLKAMKLEAAGNFTAALDIYDAILDKDPANLGARKRKICIFKAQEKLPMACKELNSYLQLLSSDEQGWQELVELYITMGKLDLAKYAAEELLLLVPENYLYHLQFAEIVYSMGGKANFLLARQYYAQSLELKKNGNLRAVYGLVMCLGAKGSNKLAPELFSWSIDKIMQEYRNVALHTAVADFKAVRVATPEEEESEFSATLEKLDFTVSPASEIGVNPNPYLPHMIHATLRI